MLFKTRPNSLFAQSLAEFGAQDPQFEGHLQSPLLSAFKLFVFSGRGGGCFLCSALVGLAWGFAPPGFGMEFPQQPEESLFGWDPKYESRSPKWGGEFRDGRMNISWLFPRGTTPKKSRLLPVSLQKPTHRQTWWLPAIPLAFSGLPLKNTTFQLFG